MDLSINLQAVVSQRLIPGVAARQVPVVEVMLLSPLIADLIKNGRSDEIKEVMGRSAELGMSTFDQSLYTAYQAGKISIKETLRNADSQTDLKLRIKLTQPITNKGEQLETVPIPKMDTARGNRV
jgi:twitching motility protein PilU